MPTPPDSQNPYAKVALRGDPPSLDQQISYQRDFRNLVAADVSAWPDKELDYADSILESLERLRALG